MAIRLRRMGTMLALSIGSALAAAPAAAQEQEIVVEAPTFRVEIERILEADNLNTATMSPRDIADAMARIAKGGAPADFWVRYQAHAGAWQRLAGLIAAAGTDPVAIQQAERAVNATFDEVERIALAYGARLPRPPNRVAEPDGLR